ncbi:hypothetical protein ABZP36_025582 [Zizania latifolia]
MRNGAHGASSAADYGRTVSSRSRRIYAPRPLRGRAWPRSRRPRPRAAGRTAAAALSEDRSRRLTPLPIEQRPSAPLNGLGPRNGWAEYTKQSSDLVAFSLLVVVEIPYVFVETAIYALIVYPMMSFQWTSAKFFWFFYVSFFTFLYFTYYGMMTVSVSPNLHVASILSAAFYTLFNLFSGFFIPRPASPSVGHIQA